MNRPMKKSPKYKLEWDLTLLYKSPNDPQIEKDVRELERLYASFAKKYDTKEKAYLRDEKKLLAALADYETLSGKASGKPIMYFYRRQHMDSEDKAANSQISLLSNRLTKAANLSQFFEISLGKIGKADQKKFLASAKLGHFHVLLARIFADAAHMLSEPEEKIMSLKGLPAYTLWVQGNEKLLGSKSVVWKGRKTPLSEAFNIAQSLEKPSERRALGLLVKKELRENSAFAEVELNAVITNKKINDELRGHKNAYDSTIQSYRNDHAVVMNLVDVVTKSFHISARYYRLKAKLMQKGKRAKKIFYEDRSARIGRITKAFSIDECIAVVKGAFGAIDPKYARILGSYLTRGQIDWKPRQGKHGGGYCSSTYGQPTFVLLNHVDSIDSFKTFAHEMGHAYHSELSEGQGPIYSDYSTSLAETASTLFEQIAFEAIFEKLSKKEKIAALEQKLNAEMATIFRQIACFNYEKDINDGVRARGFLAKEELAALHNKNMQAYLGDAVSMDPDDGYFFAAWSHLRYFFYVYSYAYGMLVSKALLRRYKQDKSFWKKIEQFLSAGGNDSPENILREIGIDVSKPDFWKDGLREIEDEVAMLEKLTKK
jgi:oligoendopeptidase F